MQRIIKYVERVATDSTTLINIAKPKKTFSVFFDDLDKYADIRTLLGDHIACFVLLRIHDSENGGVEPIGHWVAIIDHGETFEYFDPYGFSWKDTFVVHETHENPNLLSDLVSKENRLVVNNIRYQKMLNNVNVCGLHCACRVVFSNLNDNDYKKLMFGWKDYDPDFVVAAVTLLGRGDVTGKQLIDQTLGGDFYQNPHAWGVSPSIPGKQPENKEKIEKLKDFVLARDNQHLHIVEFGRNEGSGYIKLTHTNTFAEFVSKGNPSLPVLRDLVQYILYSIPQKHLFSITGDKLQHVADLNNTTPQMLTKLLHKMLPSTTNFVIANKPDMEN